MSERDEQSPFATIPERYAAAASELARRLRFPVDSKAALAEQLGGTEASLKVGEETAAVSSWLMFMPAHSFPLASPLDDAWPSRYLAEELWLRGRRQVAFGLVRRGRFLAPDAMTQLAERHEKQGRAAYERLMEGLPPEDRRSSGRS